MKIAVFAGHGGSDYGASVNGLYEKDLNLQVVLALSNELRNRGYTVINNRTTDVNRSIVADARLANSENVDAVIEIHMNSNNGIPAEGTETYYSITGRGKELAQAINTNLVALGLKDRGIKTFPNLFGQDYLGIIRNTNAPAVLVEVLFMNNPNDLAKFDPPVIANAIANAVEEIFPLTNNNTSTNNTIKSIQQTLNNRYNTNLVVDGIYGPKTRKAIIIGLQTELNKQFNANLVVDGVFGPKTKEALPNVKKGATGNITYLIQVALFILGYNVIPDGIFGNKTENAVRQFQQRNNLFVDGIAGKQTLRLLFEKI